MVKKISQSEFSNVKSDNLAVVDFSAVWCGPCNMLAPVMEELSGELEGKASFYNVDVDENPELAKEYGIMSIPAILIMKNGQQVDMQIGFQPKESLKEAIEKFTN